MPELNIDPTTGEPFKTAPTDGGTGDPSKDGPKFIQIDAREWEGLKSRLDAFESGYRVGGQSAQQVQPPQPQGPTLMDQIKEIDKSIAALNDQIDAAVADGKPVSKLLTERDSHSARKLRLQIKAEDIDPAMNAGIQTIDQLSAEVTRGEMKYLHIPGVKAEYETALSSLSPDQRMNPQMRKAAYRMAVGKAENLDAIMSAQREEILRSATPAAGAEPTGNNGRTQRKREDGIPEPKEILEPSALAAIRSKGITVDAYYKTLGYEGWNDFWTKTGKNYFGTEIEES